MKEKLEAGIIFLAIIAVSLTVLFWINSCHSAEVRKWQAIEHVAETVSKAFGK